MSSSYGSNWRGERRKDGGVKRTEALEVRKSNSPGSAGADWDPVAPPALESS